MPTFSEIQNMRVGVWSYSGGVSGTVNTASLLNANDINMDEVRVLSVTAIAGASDATIAIDNRGTVPIPAGQAITLTPNGTIRNPVIVFTNTSSYCIEFVTNNFLGSTKGNI